MKSLNVSDVMKSVVGMTAVVTGPFLVFDLTAEGTLFESLEVGEHGMEEIPSGQTTQPHTHDFVSVYKVSDLDLIFESTNYALPARALVIVFPGVLHSWVPSKDCDGGAVGSCDTAHEQQILEPAP